MILTLFEPATAKRIPLPTLRDPVSAGFPSPAADCMDGTIDLNEQLIRRPHCTFLVRIEGDSMTGAGIRSGDLAVVDRSLTPRNDDIVIAIVGGELTMKRLVKTKSRIMLAPENPAYAPIILRDENDLLVWGVVSSIVRTLRTD